MHAILKTAGISAFCAFGVLAAGCAAGDAPRAQAAQAGAQAATCRDVLQPGSNVLRRLCLTEAGWADYDAANRRGAREFLRRVTDQGAIAGAQQ